MSRLCNNLVDAEGYPENRVVPGKTAVRAVVDAFVGQVKWSEKPYRASEILSRECCGLAGDIFKLNAVHWP